MPVQAGRRLDMSNIYQPVLLVATALACASPVLAGDKDQDKDFGQAVEQRLEAKSQPLFGFNEPVPASATAADVIPRNEANAMERQFLAHGLKAQFVTRSVGGLADMIAFWPNDIDYTHLILCNEWPRSGTTPGGNGGRNPSVQRINIETGEVENILFGMSRCDGIRTTQWGTVLATEENGADGSAYEIIDPLNTTGHWIYDRGAAGVVADIRTAIDGTQTSTNIVKRIALVAQSWEGLEVLDNGVVIGGDELRTDEDYDGGAVFRFVPDTFYECEGAPVCSGDNDYGQGCEYGAKGRWVEVNAATARFDAHDNGATGYCRPEDLHVDRSYGRFAGGEGIRWCWNNSCGGQNGETLCVIENDAAVDAKDEVLMDMGGTAGVKAFLANDPALAEANITRFVENDAEMRCHDNLDIQPYTSNVYIIEDFTFGDIWACLPDGADRDQKSDGCVRMLSVRDPEAEPSGFIFDGTGTVAFYHLQHGQQFDELLDFDSNPMNGHTDDLIKITGFKVRKGRGRHHDDD